MRIFMLYFIGFSFVWACVVVIYAQRENAKWAEIVNRIVSYALLGEFILWYIF